MPVVRFVHKLLSLAQSRSKLVNFSIDSDKLSLPVSRSSKRLDLVSHRLHFTRLCCELTFKRLMPLVRFRSRSIDGRLMRFAKLPNERFAPPLRTNPFIIPRIAFSFRIDANGRAHRR
jgi:hypothetical protein